MDTGGIFRCEVSNEFPDFDTVTTAEILNVVGKRDNISALQSLSNLNLPQVKQILDIRKDNPLHT